MLFNSYTFLLIYLPVVFIGFFRLAKYSYRLAALWLAAASVFFYGYWNPAYVGLLLGSIVVNYGVGYRIGHIVRSSRQAKVLLAGTIAVNLALLGYFKYANFFLGNLEGMTGFAVTPLDIILPLGISFFTFTQIAFLVDVRNGATNEYNFITYLLFVTYFPHLIAGPVLHHKQVMPQFSRSQTYRINWKNIAIGLTIFAIGLAKKVLIADSLAPIADGVFKAASEGRTIMLFEAWFGALAYTFQLYFDFSGYSDMAIGLSRLFNVRLPLNFDSPYRATSIVEFWRRWHMTLSDFLRDYLYIPLGGNRVGSLRRYANVFATMLLGGLWHGANWTFVVWGALHGIYLIINFGWRALCARLGLRWRGPRWMASLLAWAITFLAVVVAWVLFRAGSFFDARQILAGLIGTNGISLPFQLADIQFGRRLAALIPWEVRFEGFMTNMVFTLRYDLPLIVVAALLAWIAPNTQQLFTKWSPALTRVSPPQPGLPGLWKPDLYWGLFVSMLLALSVLGFSGTSAFLYFQF